MGRDFVRMTGDLGSLTIQLVREENPVVYLRGIENDVVTYTQNGRQHNDHINSSMGKKINDRFVQMLRSLNSMDMANMDRNPIQITLDTERKVLYTKTVPYFGPGQLLSFNSFANGEYYIERSADGKVSAYHSAASGIISKFNNLHTLFQKMPNDFKQFEVVSRDIVFGFNIQVNAPAQPTVTPSEPVVQQPAASSSITQVPETPAVPVQTPVPVVQTAAQAVDNNVATVQPATNNAPVNTAPASSVTTQAPATPAENQPSNFLRPTFRAVEGDKAVIELVLPANSFVYLEQIKDYKATYTYEPNGKQYTSAIYYLLGKKINDKFSEISKQLDPLRVASLTNDHGLGLTKEPLKITLNTEREVLYTKAIPNFREDQLVSIYGLSYIGRDKNGNIVAYEKNAAGVFSKCEDMELFLQSIVNYQEFEVVDRDSILGKNAAPQTPEPTLEPASNSVNVATNVEAITPQQIAGGQEGYKLPPANSAATHPSNSAKQPAQQTNNSANTQNAEQKMLSEAVKNFIISLVGFDQVTDQTKTFQARIKAADSKNAALVRDSFVEALTPAFMRIVNDDEFGKGFRKIIVNGTADEKDQFVSKALTEIYKHEIFSGKVKFNYLGKEGNIFKTLIEWVHAVVCKLLGNDTPMKAWKENRAQIDVKDPDGVKQELYSSEPGKKFTDVFIELGNAMQKNGR